jgi:hypothetical protein
MSGGRGKHCITHPQASDDLLCEQIIDHYRRALAHHKQARRFLLAYGIFGNRLLSDFRLGCCDRTLGLRLQRLEREQEAYTRGALQRLGLLKLSGHEFLPGLCRVSLPRCGREDYRSLWQTYYSEVESRLGLPGVLDH